MASLLQVGMVKLQDLLSESLMKKVCGAGRKSSYVDSQLIQQRGDSQSGFSIVESGQIVAGNEDSDGNFLVATLLNPGDHFGDITLFAGLPIVQNLRAVGDSVVTHIPAKKFQALFEKEHDLSRALLTISLRRIHFMMEFIDGQRRWPLPVRIAHLLLTSVEDRDNTI